MAAEVSLPVCEVCDPRRGRHMLPVSTRYASAAVSRMVSKASRRLPRFCARSVTSSSSRDLISVPSSCSRWRSRRPGISLSVERSRRWVWASSMLTKPHSRLSRSSLSCVPSGPTPLGEDAERLAHGVDGIVGIPDVPGVERVALGRRAVERCVLAGCCCCGMFVRFDVVDDGHDDLPILSCTVRSVCPR